MEVNAALEMEIFVIINEDLPWEYHVESYLALKHYKPPILNLVQLLTWKLVNLPFGWKSPVMEVHTALEIKNFILIDEDMQWE